MAVNPASAYGKSIACITDADAFFSSVTGVPLVVQDAIHRITTDNVLGEDGDGWGFDIRRLLGMPANKLAAQQPVLSAVLQRDVRILHADVKLTPVFANGNADVRCDVVGMTALGPFDFSRMASGANA